MQYYSKAVIVWIDDHFLTQTFKEDKQKHAWHKLFGKINSKVYRLLDIKIKYIATAKDALDYIKLIDRFKSNTYYYFVIDRKLPYDRNDDAVDSNSEKIIKYLQNAKEKYHCLDFSVLSSGTPESYAIKNIDYHLKPQNKEFTLPDELRHKILLKIKDSIAFIDQKEFGSGLKLNSFGAESFQFVDDSTWLFPFIGKYRAFVELEEIGKKDFSTLIVSAPLSVSDRFVLQSLFISLYEYLEDYTGINFYKDSSYGSFKLSGNFEEVNELTDQIPVIRFDRWDVESYSNISTHLKHKRIRVFVIDSDDENLSNYIDTTYHVKIIKVDIVTDNVDISKTILEVLLKQYLNKLKFDIENSIYDKNNILLVHPLIKALLSERIIRIENFDDPSEIIYEIQKYLKNLDLSDLGEGDIIAQCLQTSQPIPLSQFEFVYDQVKNICEDDKRKYNELLVKTLYIWLSNSWNVNYNVDMDEFEPKVQEKWQSYSFDILKELIKKIDFSYVEDKNLIEIKKTIEYIDENLQKNKNKISPSKILWPHEKYPMPIYLQNELFKNSNKKLYVQDKDLVLMDDSIEINNSFRNLEYKIRYYRSIFSLIENSAKYMPSEIRNTILELSDRIQRNDIFVDDFTDEIILHHKEAFKKLANIFLRIAINFGLVATDTKPSELNYMCNSRQPYVEDKAGLGKLLSDIRDHIYKKRFAFEYVYKSDKIMCSSYINSEKYIDFLINSCKVSDKKAAEIIKINRNPDRYKSIFEMDRDKNIKNIAIEVEIVEDFVFKDKKFKKGETIPEKEAEKINRSIEREEDRIQFKYKDIDEVYLNKLFIANNISQISYIANLSAYLMQNEHHLKIQKHMGAYSLLAYLADTRNTWEHGDDKAWHRELFIESFIYGYE